MSAEAKKIRLAWIAFAIALSAVVCCVAAGNAYAQDADAGVSDNNAAAERITAIVEADSVEGEAHASDASEEIADESAGPMDMGSTTETYEANGAKAEEAESCSDNSAGTPDSTATETVEERAEYAPDSVCEQGIGDLPSVGDGNDREVADDEATGEAASIETGSDNEYAASSKDGNDEIAVAQAAAVKAPAVSKSAAEQANKPAKKVASPVKSGWYSIKTALNTGFCIQVKGNNSRAGTKLVIAGNSTATGQAFKIVKAGAYYRLMAGTGFNSRILMSSNGKVALGQSKGKDSLFKIVQNADGSLVFIGRASGRVLAVKGGRAQSGAYLFGARLVQGRTAQAFGIASRKGILKNGVYSIRTGLKGKRAVGSKGASLAAGAKTTLAKYQAALYQKWQIKAVAGRVNTYTIENLATGYRVTAISGKAAKLKHANTATTQMWKPVGAHGQVFFKNVKTGKMLSLYDAKSSAGTTIMCYDASTKASARWTVKKAAILNTGFYTFGSAANRALALEVKDGSDAQGANARIATTNGNDNQIWLYNSKDKTLSSVSSGKNLGVAGSSTLNGANVAQFNAQDSNAQKWTVKYMGGGNFKVTSKLGSSLVLNAVGTVSGSNVTSATYNGAATQHWHVVQLPADKTSEAAINLTLDEMARLQKNGNPTYSSTTIAYLKSVLNPANGSKYKYIDLRKGTGLTGAQLDKFINTNGAHGKMAGLGAAFASACKKYSLNEAYLVAHAILESGWGSSELASGYYYAGGFIDGVYYKKGTYYNFFGIGAYDSSPLSGGRKAAIINGWNSPSKAVTGAAKWISTNYTYRENYAQPTLYAMKWDYVYTNKTGERGWHQYATSLTWADSIGRLIEQCYAAAGVNPSLTYIKPKYR